MNDYGNRVIGTRESRPLEFWVGVPKSSFLQLDEVVAVETPLPVPSATGATSVTHYGVVDEVESSHEGAVLHSDVFRIAHGMSPYWLHVGGWAGIVTAGVAWYASAAGVVNGMSPRPVLPVGAPMWGPLPVVTRWTHFSVSRSSSACWSDVGT